MPEPPRLIACLRCRSRKVSALLADEWNPWEVANQDVSPSQNVPGRLATKAVNDVLMQEKNVRLYPIAEGGSGEQSGRLSDSAKAAIKQRYTARSRHLSPGGLKRKRSSEEENNCPSSRERTANGGLSEQPAFSPSDLHVSPAGLVPIDIARLATSSVRVNAETQAAIGPTCNRTTSIARLFTPKRNDRMKRPGLSLYRDDPITCGYLSEAMAKDLFAFFMQNMADRLFVFDIFLHTYEYVQHSSTFLFCAILATAARFSVTAINQVTQQRCLALAKDHMLKVFSDNQKTEETIQALYILTEYKEIEDEDGYLLLGMVSGTMDSMVRIALDIDLSRPRPELSERENRSRIRIWLVLYCADRRFNYCGQTAKPCMMPEDETVCACKDFVNSHLCLAIDHRIADNVALRRQLAVHIEAIDADVDCHLDLRREYYTMESKATKWQVGQTFTEADTPHHARLAALLASVVIAHRWVHRSFRDEDSSRGVDARETERREALAVCIQGSLGILETLRQISLDTLRYGSDSKHLYFAYGSFFLQKVFDTGIAVIMLDRPSLAYTLTLLQECSQRLEEAAAYPSSTAAFHASFLRHLMSSCEQVMRQVTDSASDPLIASASHASPRVVLLDETVERSMSGQAAPEEQFLEAPPYLQASAQVAQGVLDPCVLRPTFDMLMGSSNDDSLGESVTWDDWWPLNDIWGLGSGNNDMMELGYQ
ncbi:hypothetical protein IAR50_000664 [Cryptococcus sp. DSM 104548]